jgi:MscS family membrane protein
MKKLSLLWVLLASILWVCHQKAWAQEDTLRLFSPFETIRTHLQYLQPDSYDPDKAAQVFEAPGLSPEQKRRLAIELIQIYEGRGLFVDLEAIPNDPDYVDSLTGKQRYVPFPEELPDVYLVKKGKKWLYSAQTVRKIPQLHRETYPFGIDKLLMLVPQQTVSRFLGLSYWQWLGLGLLLVLSFILHKLFTFIIQKILLRIIIRWRKKTLTQHLLLPTARPLSLFLVFHLLKLLIPVLQLPVGLTRFLILGVRISIAVFVGFILVRALDFVSIYMRRFAEKTESKLDDQLVPLLERILKVLVWVSVGVAIMNLLNFNIAAVLTGLSISGLAVALAAQDTIKNLFGSLTIFIDKPFQIGDWIVSERIDGTVEEVGFRSTRIRTFNDSLISVPNGKLADMIIDNMGARVYRRFVIRLAVTYDTPPELLEAYVQGLRNLILNHPDTRKENFYVYVNDLISSAIEIFFSVYLKVPDRDNELRARHELILDMLRLAKKLGVRFAFPTQTIHIEEAPGQGSLAPQYETNPSELQKRLQAFFSERYNGTERKQG